MLDDEAMTCRALDLLGSRRNDSYDAALAALRENMRDWWADVLAATYSGITSVFRQRGCWRPFVTWLFLAGAGGLTAYTGLPHEAVPVSKLESGAHLPASELAEAERKPG